MKKLNIRILIFFVLITLYVASQNNNEFVTSKYTGLYGNQFNHTYNSKDFQDVSDSETLIVYPETDSTVLFYFQKNIGAPSYNIGQLYGRLLVKNNIGNYYENMGFEDGLCEFKVFFSDEKIIIKTIKDSYNCGFGNNVFIDGEYDRKSRNKIDFFIDIENNKTFFKNIYENELKIEYEDTDIHKIKQKISSEYNLWLKKGEFEKTNEYLKRMTLREFQFLEICDNAVLEKLSEKVEFLSRESWYGDNNGEESLILYEYNADKEFFPFYFRYKQIEFRDTIYIPFEDAEQFKDHTNYHSISFPKKRNDYFFSNYYLYPSKIIFQNINKKTPIEVSLNFNTPLQAVRFDTDELNLSNYSFEKIQYDFQNFKQRKSEILISNAQKYEESEDLENALILYTKIVEFDKNSEFAKSKVETITKSINERKRGLAITEAEKLFKNGQLCKSKEKYLEANSIRKSDEINEIIWSIENTISESNQKHNELLTLFNQIENNNSFMKNNQTSENLEKIKKGYSEKYNICLDTINYILKDDKTNLKKIYEGYLKILNKDIWSSENQNLVEVFKDFNSKYEKLKIFDENILRAIQNDDRKYLKVLKEENINLIIDTVIKTKIR